MDLQLTDTMDVSSTSKLPDEPTLAARARALAERIGALRAAPVAEPYVGPAILDGRAASVFFHETFGHRVEGHRQKNDREGQTSAEGRRARDARLHRRLGRPDRLHVERDESSTDLPVRRRRNSGPSGRRSSTRAS